MILILSLTLLAWICGLLLSLHYLRLGRLAKKAKSMPIKTEGLPGISIIITVHNQEHELRANLPRILCQDYPAPFEVIVVDTNSEDGTMKMLEEMEKEYVHLRHTFCPDTARDISLSRLAITLGIRSACYEWSLLLAADAVPTSDVWLTTMAQSFTDDVDAAQGFVSYRNLHGWTGARWQFFRLWQQTLWMPWTTHFAPYRADISCLAYRKSLFMSHQGFASSFSLRYGAGTLLVNHNIRRGRMALCLHPDALLQELQPVSRLWRQERVFFMETHKHMKHAFGYRLWYATNIMGHYLWMALAAISLTCFMLPVYYAYAALALWVVSQIVAGTSWHITAHRLGARSYVVLLPMLQAMIPLWDTAAWLRWRFESRKSFRKKFV